MAINRQQPDYSKQGPSSAWSNIDHFQKELEPNSIYLTFSLIKEDSLQVITLDFKLKEIVDENDISVLRLNPRLMNENHAKDIPDAILEITYKPDEKGLRRVLSCKGKPSWIKKLIASQTPLIDISEQDFDQIAERLNENNFEDIAILLNKIFPGPEKIFNFNGQFFNKSSTISDPKGHMPSNP